MSVTDQLQRLHQQGALTRYELAIQHPDGRRYLVAYTSRKSRDGMLTIVRSRAVSLLAACRLPDTSEIRFADRAADGAMIGEWHVNYTDRTQRQAICEGELTFIDDVGEGA